MENRGINSMSMFCGQMSLPVIHKFTHDHSAKGSLVRNTINQQRGQTPINVTLICR